MHSEQNMIVISLIVTGFYYVNIIVIPFVVSLLTDPFHITDKSFTRTSSIMYSNHAISFAQIVSALVNRCFYYIWLSINKTGYTMIKIWSA